MLWFPSMAGDGLFAYVTINLLSSSRERKRVDSLSHYGLVYLSR